MSDLPLRHPSGPTVSLHIDGMSCAACVGRVERALLALPDVGLAQVNLATERATVTWAAPQADDTQLLDAIQGAGYHARVVRDDAPREDMAQSAERQRQQHAQRRQLLLAALLTAPLFVLEMGAHVIPGMHEAIARTIGMQANWVIQFILTSAVLFGPGRPFYAKGLPALWRRAPDMNALVAVGTLAAYLFSTVATFAPGWLPRASVAVYFEAAAVIVTLVLLGRYLEARARGRSSEAIGRLLRLQPETARVRRGDRIEDIALSALALGDLVDVRPGERVPADGEVTEGESHVDESMITGEAMPVRKARGDSVTGGTINQHGALTVRTRAVGAQTVLAQIIRMVEQAQADKLPIQALVDRVTLWFVPVVMALAALTFAVWLVFGPEPSLQFALVNAVAVLIVACPCAMGLATPTSIMVGTGRAAQMGIVFRRGEALQTLKGTAVVAFDKTGTLTLGEPVLTDMILAAGQDRHTLLAQVAAVEARTEHPVGRALVQAAQQEGLTWPPAEAFQSVTGQGVRGEVAGVTVQVGSDRYMRTLGLDPSVFAAQATQLAGQGKTPMYAAVAGQLAAILAVADDLRPGARTAVDALHAMRIKVAMISGDDERTARAIARRLGIDDVVAGVLPEGKVEAITRLQAEYGMLAFVGDGINDAPALARADVGIAVGSGTDIAIESADVVLMTRDLKAVAGAVSLSRATLANIRQNLFWAFAYNAALIPVAAGLLYPVNGALLSPMLAAGAMALSSVFVVGNALRLRRVKAT